MSLTASLDQFKNGSYYVILVCMARLDMAIFFLDTISPLMTHRASLMPATMMSKLHFLFSKMPEFEKKPLKLQFALAEVFRNKFYWSKHTS